jgi:Uma2 family endonuclease
MANDRLPARPDLATFTGVTMPATLAAPSETICLRGISWQTYEALSAELGDRSPRLTYNAGTLEIMAPSPEHEFSKKIMGRFVETLAEESNLPIYPLGSITLKRYELSGAEPDECFYIQNIAAIQGKKRIDLSQDPAPDLVIEIDITSRSINRLDIYADLGIREVWLYDGVALTIYHLVDRSADRLADRSTAQNIYQTVATSQFFPKIPVTQIATFLQAAPTSDYLELVKTFRAWVRTCLDQVS